MGAPLLAGLLAGQAQLALQASLGALPGVINDQGGSYRGRLRRIAFAVLAATGGYLAGAWIVTAFGTALPAWAALGAVALISAVATAGGNVVSVAGLQLLVFATVGSGRPLTGDQAWQAPLAVLAGGLWMLAVVAASGLRRSYAAERRAVAAVYRALARYLGSVGTSDAESARRDLTAALNSGYDAVLNARSGARGRDPETVRLVTLLGDVTPVIEAAVAVSRESDRPLPPQVPAVATDMAEAVLGKPLPDGRPDLPGTTPGMAALREGLADAAATLARPHEVRGRDPERTPGPRPAQVSLRDSVWRTLRDILVPGRRTGMFAVRLTACIVVAQVLRDVLPVERSYWIPLAVAIVLRPDLGPVVVRAFLSVAGTVLGVAVGTAVIIAVPSGFPAAAVTVVVAAMLPLALSRNFGLFWGLISLLLLLLLEQVGQADLAAAQARLVDTVIGSLIVLVVGYLPWRSARRVDVGPNFADAVDRVVSYLRCSLTDPGSAERPALRRTAYRTLSDVRTVFQRALAEPPPQRRRAAAWWPAIVALERVVDAATAAALSIMHGAPLPSAEGVERLAGALEDAAAAAREGRDPRQYPAPGEEILHGLAVEVRAVRTGLAGPAAAAASTTTPP